MDYTTLPPPRAPALTSWQVRISELKEIVSFRGGIAPSALQPEVGSESDLESTNHNTAAASSAAAPADRRELREAMGDLSQCIHLADEEALQLSGSNADLSANISAKTARIMRALALEDASTCSPCFQFTATFPFIFHTDTSGSGLCPQKTSSKLSSCWKLPSNQKVYGAKSRLLASLPASSRWCA